jgi:hypothetical protein
MRRLPRGFRAECFELERRLLLASAPASTPPTLAPEVVSVKATSQGIVVSFNKPMNPVGASNVHNYAVGLMNITWHPFGMLGILGVGNTSHSLESVRLRSAQYDPATQSVTLIPKRRNAMTVLMEGDGVRQARTWVRPGHPLKVARGLTDLEGNPINSDTTPGKVDLRITYNVG